MSKPCKIVISASRRTDVPAFYMPWFMEQLAGGCFKVVNPYNQKVFTVAATPQQVHSIVLWSKNFGPFIAGDYAGQLERMGYHLFFNFTINSHAPLLEPNVPPLEERLGQLAWLCDRFGPRAVNWRFDPLCFYQTPGAAIEDNRQDFAAIAHRAAACGIERCITSFMDHYPKIRKRTARRNGPAFVDPPLERKAAIVGEMEKQLQAEGIRLSLCCEKEVLAALPAHSAVAGSACIPGGLLQELYGAGLSLKKDAGQRVKAGCGCSASKDIGSYQLQPCYHNCLFCYANPSSRPISGSPF